MSVLLVKGERKARPMAWADASPGLRGHSNCTCLAPGLSLSCWITAPLQLWYWVLMGCSCSTAGPHLPQVVVFEESLEQFLCYVLFGVCKIPSQSWKTKSSLRTPRSCYPVLEKWALQVKREARGSPGPLGEGGPEDFREGTLSLAEGF